MKKRWKRAVKIKALPPLPLSLLPQSSSRSRVVWSRSCGGLLGSEAVVVEVDQEQLSQVEQTRAACELVVCSKHAQLCDPWLKEASRLLSATCSLKFLRFSSNTLYCDQPGIYSI